MGHKNEDIPESNGLCREWWVRGCILTLEQWQPAGRSMAVYDGMRTHQLQYTAICIEHAGVKFDVLVIALAMHPRD